MRELKTGFGVSPSRSFDVDDLLQFAITGEKLGFDSIHLPDHVSIQNETLTTMTAMVMKAKRIKVATGVLDMNRRNPATLAHMTATIDVISGGRLILGVGCGMWNAASYNAKNVGDKGKNNVRRKVSRAKEAIEVLKKLWVEPIVNYKGEFYNYENASVEAKTLQKPHPPIWIAAYGNRMKMMAAELGDGFITQTLPPFIYKEEVGKVRTFTEKFGRDPKKIKNILATLTSVDNTRDAALKAIEKNARSLLFNSIRGHASHHLRIAERLGYGGPIPWKKPGDIPEKALYQSYIIGTPEDVITKIEEYKRGGMNYLVAMGLNTKKSLNLFSDKVIHCFD